MRGISFAAALGAMLNSGKGGDAVLTEMFTPRFHVPQFGEVRIKPGKHRNSGKGSPWRRGGNNAGHGKAHVGAKQCRKYAAQKPGGDTREFDKRMAWNERNPHVLAKREADQLKARSDTGGRNAIIWGRR